MESSQAVADEFSKENFKSVIQKLSTNPEEHLDINTWVSFLQEILHLFQLFGKPIGKAFQDIKSKSEIIARNQIHLQKLENIENLDNLYEAIKLEEKHNATGINGENNKKVLSKEEMQTWKGQYASITRTVFRNMWLLDFLFTFFGNMQDAALNLSKAAKRAYKEGLAPHHPWAVKQAAKLGFNVCPKKEVFLAKTNFTLEDFKEMQPLV